VELRLPLDWRVRLVLASLLSFSFAQVGPAAPPRAVPVASAQAPAAVERDSHISFNQPVERDVRFGLNQAWEAQEAADLAGAGWSRLTFWWSAFQPNGPDDFNLFATDQDSYIDAELDRGRELAGLVLNVPAWASSNGTPNGVPKGLYRDWDDPANSWGQFMRHLAAHYRGRIDSWIIWNEVDIPAGQWRTWDGSVEDYAQLLRVSYRAIKAGNPSASVVLYGSPWWYDHGAGLTRLLDVLAADPDARAAHYYFDVANLHMYSRANDIPRIIGWYREQLASRGIIGKRLWVSETNTVPYDDPLWLESKAGYRATLDEQASYLVEAFATFLALGVDRIGVNRLIDGSDFAAGGEPFGLLRNDRSARPAFGAFQVVSRYFAGARTATYLPTDASGLTGVVLEKDGERVTVLWTMRPERLRVPVDALGSQALRVTKAGTAEVISARDGVFQIDLAPATANSNLADPSDYVVGGSPVILVERIDGNMSLAYRPLDVPPRPGLVASAGAAPARLADPGPGYQPSPPPSRQPPR
jgi:hypothetical protein